MRRNDRGRNQPGRSAPQPGRQATNSGSAVGERAMSTGLLTPLPAAVRDLAAKVEHPGLWLDKYAATWNPAWLNGRDETKLSETVQKPALEWVAELTRQAANNAGNHFAAAADHHHAMLNAMDARQFTATTAGPLTLHLARAGVLENAGLALHPLYGFVYLPGSGLKGMARAYAEAVWLPSLPPAEQGAAWRRIEDVFGWAPNPDRRRQLADREHPAEPRVRDGREITAARGGVVFHDAWPEAWPKLVVDIVNNHHPAYYEAAADKVPPPGDWENPHPVYFLAVERDTRFRFALAPARRDTDPALLETAEQWLLGALTHEGAGAKTAAGYGRFRAEDRTAPAPPEKTRATFKAELELVTPAFLAGAGQGEKDCDLRPATLRGILRWWWRTLHAGFLTPAELRTLETAVWGSAEVGGAVRIAVEPVRKNGPHPFDYKDRFDPKRDFRNDHGLANRPNNKTTQGLFYLSFGMDEISKGQRVQRYYLGAGSSWQIRITARASQYRGPSFNGQMRITASQALKQAEAALWLLCHFGGVGSKARNGFGSFAQPDELETWDLSGCREVADQLREWLGLANEFVAGHAASAALDEEEWPITAEIALASGDPWQVLDALGFAYQAFAQQYKHDHAKAALGLPRKIHGPKDKGPMQNQDPATWLEPEWLRSSRWDRKVNPQKARYASPVHFHIARGAERLVVHVAAFPTADLPDLATSKTVLRELAAYLKDDLPVRIGGQGNRIGRTRPADQPAPSALPVSTKRAHGTAVTVVFLGPREKRGFRVQEPGKPEGTLTLGPPPDPLPDIDSEIRVFIHNDDLRTPQYRWDAPPAPRSKNRAGRHSRDRY